VQRYSGLDSQPASQARRALRARTRPRDSRKEFLSFRTCGLEKIADASQTVESVLNMDAEATPQDTGGAAASLVAVLVYMLFYSLLFVFLKRRVFSEVGIIKVIFGSRAAAPLPAPAAADAACKTVSAAFAGVCA